MDGKDPDCFANLGRPVPFSSSTPGVKLSNYRLPQKKGKLFTCRRKSWGRRAS